MKPSAELRSTNSCSEGFRLEPLTNWQRRHPVVFQAGTVTAATSSAWRLTEVVASLAQPTDFLGLLADTMSDRYRLAVDVTRS